VLCALAAMQVQSTRKGFKYPMKCFMIETPLVAQVSDLANRRLTRTSGRVERRTTADGGPQGEAESRVTVLLRC
jgi:hypothetical protein